MAERAMQHRRTHNLLLFQRLLSLREGSSPFTLVLDSLEQSGKSLIAEYVRHAKATKTSVVYVIYDALNPPLEVDVVIKARRKDTPILQKEISRALGKNTKSLIIFETLHPLATDSSINLPAFLSSFASVQTSLLATYHHDISISPTEFSPYTPSPLILLSYLATTIFKVHSLRQVLARKRAAQKSLAEPVFGLNEELEGVILGLGSNDPRGIVLEMEHRRKSGRAVGEWYFLPSNLTGGEHRKERMMLLDDHPLVKAPGDERNIMAEDIEDETTFSLGLTEKQKRDREGVLLPYFDAQKEGGGRGGRILYDMGVEDDFDEEEDEI